MSHAAVLIQNQFRTYYAKRKKREDAGTCARRESERVKKCRNQSVIIQERYRSLDGKEGTGHIPGTSDAPDSSPPHPETNLQFPEGTPQRDADPTTLATTLAGGVGNEDEDEDNDDDNAENITHKNSSTKNAAMAARDTLKKHVSDSFEDKDIIDLNDTTDVDICGQEVGDGESNCGFVGGVNTIE